MPRLKPETVASDLRISERVMLFCVASGYDWHRAGVTHATARHLLERGLINRASTLARFELTPLGRRVAAVLFELPDDEQDG
jgi:hypothetical protein